MAIDATFREPVLTRAEDFPEHFAPVLDRLTIYFHDNLSNKCRSDTLVSESEVNVGRVTAVEFENRPDCGAHLLALHISGVTGNAQGKSTNQGRYDRLIAADRT